MLKPFNYIVPIHNKADILGDTLNGIATCCSRNAHIYTILDGCTDGSEAVVDTFIKQSGLDVHKLYMPDVHMLLSVNAALRQVREGFTIVMQDDIVLQETALEEKVLDLYDRMGPRLGVVSFRLGANIRKAGLKTQIRQRQIKPMIEACDCLQGPDDHQVGVPVGSYDHFYPRMVAINGPNCIPETVLHIVGILDEQLAPFGDDDPDYCMRAMKAGFYNGLYPLRYKSELAWGGTRRDPAFVKRAREVHIRNRKYLWKKHGEFIRNLWQSDAIYRGTEPLAALPNNDNVTPAK
jgi:glycosyltransferase involved in cell wall biosynthesis